MELVLIGIVILLISIIIFFILKYYYEKKLQEIDGFEGIFEEDSEEADPKEIIDS